jgi:hypothetical protein
VQLQKLTDVKNVEKSHSNIKPTFVDAFVSANAVQKKKIAFSLSFEISFSFRIHL